MGSVKLGESSENLTCATGTRRFHEKKTVAKTTLHKPSNKIEFSLVQSCCGRLYSSKKCQQSNDLEFAVVQCYCGSADSRKEYQPSNELEFAVVQCCCGRSDRAKKSQPSN